MSTDEEERELGMRRALDEIRRTDLFAWCLVKHPNFVFVCMVLIASLVTLIIWLSARGG